MSCTLGLLLSPLERVRGNTYTITRPTSPVLNEKSLLDYGEEDEAYLYLDPKLGERADPAAARSRGPPREVIVFMIGGGCYSEYQNLQVRAVGRVFLGVEISLGMGM